MKQLILLWGLVPPIFVQPIVYLGHTLINIDFRAHAQGGPSELANLRQWFFTQCSFNRMLSRPLRAPPYKLNLGNFNRVRPYTSIDRFWLAKKKKMTMSTEEAKRRVNQWLKQSDSLRICMFGKLGAGKSTLINSLLNREVAEVGDSLGSVTKKTQDHSGTINKLDFSHMKIYNIDVMLWDTPGLQDPEVDKESVLNDIKTTISGKIDLYIYCIQMTQSRAEQGDIEAIRDLTTTLGHEFWTKALFVLTHANEVRVPPSSEGMSLQDYFGERVKMWEKFLIPAVRRAGVELNIAERIPVIPAGYKKQPLPIIAAAYSRWFARFWRTCLNRIALVSVPALLIVSGEDFLNEINGEDLRIRPEEAQIFKLIDDDIAQTMRNLAEVSEDDLLTFVKQGVRENMRSILL